MTRHLLLGDREIQNGKMVSQGKVARFSSLCYFNGNHRQFKDKAHAVSSRWKRFRVDVE